MIHIIDNGEAYSGHEINFVETDLTAEQLTNLIAKIQESPEAIENNRRLILGCEPKVIASAPSFEWRDDNTATPLLKYLWAFHDDPWTAYVVKAIEDVRHAP